MQEAKLKSEGKCFFSVKPLPKRELIVIWQHT